MNKRVLTIVKEIDSYIYDNEKYYDIRDFSVIDEHCKIVQKSKDVYRYIARSSDNNKIVYSAIIEFLDDNEYQYSIYLHVDLISMMYRTKAQLIYQHKSSL